MINATKESPEEKEARRFFEEDLHLSVTRVPSSTSKSPDFLVDGETPGYVVEVKSRFDDDGFARELQSGSTEVRSRALRHDRWAEDNARKALKQLISADSVHERYRVVWFAVECMSSADAMFDQVIGTLYGVRQVAFQETATKRGIGRDCLFAVPGVFERWPDIDCAIVTMRSQITLCVNEFSEKAGLFQSSTLYQSFARLGGPISPSRLEANSGFLSVSDRTIDRTNEDAVCHYLSQKYGLTHVHILNMKAYSASAMLPRRDA